MKKAHGFSRNHIMNSSADDWNNAIWIGGGHVFRKIFHVQDTRHLTLRLSALGVFFAELDGRRLPFDLLVPVQSNYCEEVFYVECRLDDYVHAGQNTLDVYVGEGFYVQSRVQSGFGWNQNVSYGNRKLLAEIFSEQGTIAVSDMSWTCCEGPWLSDNPYAGEIYDSRHELGPGTLWQPVISESAPGGVLRRQPIRGEVCCRRLKVRRIKETSSGTTVLDFGENIAGRCVLKTAGLPSGTVITLRYAEELAEDGSIDFASTGVFATKCIPTDKYICNGKATEWGCMFSYKGFRYVEVQGYPGSLSSDAFVAEVMHTALAETAKIRTSHRLLNQIMNMAKRTLEGNLHGFPTDCPDREKCGWLGDAHVIAPWANYVFNLRDFWRTYCGDILTSYQRHGVIPMVSPGERCAGEAWPDWGHAIVEIPYMNYCFYGDRTILEQTYPLMKVYANNVMAGMKKGLVVEGLGDFIPPGSLNSQTVPISLVTSCLFLKALRMMSRIASLLGEKSEAKIFAAHAHTLASRCLTAFYNASEMSFGSQTGDVFGLLLDLVPEPETTAKILHQELALRNWHANCGIFGRKYLCEVLCKTGYADDVVSLLTATGYPSICDLIRQGATTFWESWEKHPVDCPHPRSRNHPMQTGFACVFFRNLGGLMIDEDFGSRGTLIYSPSVPAGINDWQVVFDSVHGRITSRWIRQGEKISVFLTTPGKIKVKVVRTPSTQQADFQIDQV